MLVPSLHDRYLQESSFVGVGCSTITMMRPDNEYSEPSSGAPTSSRDTYDTTSDRDELEAFLSQKEHEEPPVVRQHGNNDKETGPSSFDPDPYSLNRVPDNTGMASPADRRMATSLIDDEGDDSVTSDVENVTAGIAGLLEMEAEPSRTTPGRVERPQQQQQQRSEQNFASPFEPIKILRPQGHSLQRRR
jgi:hypothetical protein